jgi:hypothetical protein
MHAWGAAATIVTAGLLAVAGVLKLIDPRPFGWAMIRLTPRGWIGWRIVSPARIGLVVGAAEAMVALAAFLSGVMGQLDAVLIASVYGGFTLVVRAAVRKGSSCGCWGSFSDGPAGGAEMARSVTLAVIALAALMGRLSTRRLEFVTAGTGAATLVLLTIVAGGAAVGARLLPTRSTVARRSRVGIDAAWVVLGRVRHRSQHLPPPHALRVPPSLVPPKP